MEEKIIAQKTLNKQTLVTMANVWRLMNEYPIGNRVISITNSYIQLSIDNYVEFSEKIGVPFEYTGINDNYIQVAWLIDGVQFVALVSSIPELEGAK